MKLNAIFIIGYLISFSTLATGQILSRLKQYPKDDIRFPENYYLDTNQFQANFVVFRPLKRDSIFPSQVIFVSVIDEKSKYRKFKKFVSDRILQGLGLNEIVLNSGHVNGDPFQDLYEEYNEGSLNYIKYERFVLIEGKYFVKAEYIVSLPDYEMKLMFPKRFTNFPTYFEYKAYLIEHFRKKLLIIRQNFDSLKFLFPSQ